MPIETEIANDAPLYTYIIASGDMRYIEINQRNIFLRRAPDGSVVLRGELPGCGSPCYADLSQIFLEYAMTCEGCRSSSEAYQYVSAFGARLAEQLAGKLLPDLAGMTATEQLISAFTLIVKSLTTPYQLERSPSQLRWRLETCPLCETGDRVGLARELTSARFGFAVMCASLLKHLNLNWRLLAPLPEQPELPLIEIHLAMKEMARSQPAGRM